MRASTLLFATLLAVVGFGGGTFAAQSPERAPRARGRTTQPLAPSDTEALASRLTEILRVKHLPRTTLRGALGLHDKRSVDRPFAFDARSWRAAGHLHGVSLDVRALVVVDANEVWLAHVTLALRAGDSERESFSLTRTVGAATRDLTHLRVGMTANGCVVDWRDDERMAAIEARAWSELPTVTDATLETVPGEVREAYRMLNADSGTQPSYGLRGGFSGLELPGRTMIERLVGAERWDLIAATLGSPNTNGRAYAAEALIAHGRVGSAERRAIYLLHEVDPLVEFCGGGCTVLPLRLSDAVRRMR